MKNRANNRPVGKKLTRLGLLVMTAALVLAMLTAPAGASTATKCTVSGTTRSVTTNVGNRINFGTDRVFVLDGAPENVKTIQVEFTNVGTNYRIKAYNDGGDWVQGSLNNNLTFTINSKTAITKDEIERNLGLLSVSYESDYYSTYYSSCTVKIKFHDMVNPPYKSIDGAANYQRWVYFGNTSSDKITLSFKNFAQGSLTKDWVGYEAENGNGTYLDGFTVSEGGVMNGTMTVTDYGNANYVSVAYQIKESTNTSWLNVPMTYVLEDGYVSYMKNYTKYSTDKKYQGYASFQKLMKVMSASDKVNIKVSGFQAGVSYDIRAVLITDGETDYPMYTNAVTVRYDKPTVNTFNVGSTNGPQEGGSFRDINLMATFNNTNYDLTTNTVNGVALEGPVLDVTLFFTDAFQVSNTEVGGQSVRQDSSVWQQVGETHRVKLQTGSEEEGTLIISRAISESWPGVQLPEVDSKSSAFKVTVKDVISGFEVYSVSPGFVIDQNPPTDPRIVTLDANGDPATDEDGNRIVLGINDGELSTVGGSNAKVTLGILGSTDEASGLKEYSYDMYYYSTEDGSTLGNSTEDVLRIMQALTPTSLTAGGKTANYTNSTALKLLTKETEDGTLVYSSLAISKDGFYRVNVVATDNMGRNSNTITSLFRVDLSLPSTPQVVLVARFESVAAAEEAGHKSSAGQGIAGTSSFFFPYDNRTYSTNTVWACLYAEPKTGKTIASYQYSRDGGLTWYDVPVSTIAMDGVAPVYYTQDTVVGNTVVKAYNDNYVTHFVYNAAIAASSQEVSGYQSYIFRTVDTLGNTSLASDSVIMRVTDKVQANSVLNHQGIEVALSLGDTDVQSSLVTPELKNRAARKINKNFYGEDGSAVWGADDFNPYLYTKDHDCTWAEADPGCTTACIDANCPFVKLQEEGYAIYLPEMVNVQGISQQSAQSGVSNWLEFDHTTAGTSGSKYYSQNYNSSGTLGVTFSLNLYSPATGSDGKLTQGALWSGDTANQSSAANNDICYINKTCQARARHFVDYSTLKKTGEAAYSTLLAMGYGKYIQSDWKFLENDQSAKKSLCFSFDVNACDFHTYYGGGFFYNSTIRKNGSTWVISGYALYVYQKSSINLYKLTNYPINTFAGNVSTNGGNLPGSYGTSIGSVTAPSGQTYYNFNIITEGTKSSVYWIGGQIPNGKSPDAFEALRKAMGNNESSYITPNGGATSSYACTFTFNNTSYVGGVAFKNAATGRPTVGSTVPTDTNLYGFGPFIIYSSHNCSSETSVYYNNISMNMNVVRKLSEVVTEPHWGSGKSKYILNINNEATSDFEDPAMATAIQWRLNNDNARFIGWGQESNQTQTMAFLDRIRINADTTGLSEAEAAEYLKAGMYETIESHNGNTYDQLDDIAEYISRQYFGSYGITDFSQPVSESMKGSISGDVPVYALEDAASINFEVTPSAYNSSTANADYPSGRWYIIHDVRGYEGVTPISRNKQYSDALDLVITKPGRYMIFFAPTDDDVKNNTLDPANAVFHFIVNQKPQARFGGQIVASEIQEDGVPLKNASGDLLVEADMPAYLEGKWNEALSNGTVISVTTPVAPYYVLAGGSTTEVTADQITQWALAQDIAAGYIVAISGDSTTYKWANPQPESGSGSGSGAVDAMGNAVAAGEEVVMEDYAQEAWGAAVNTGYIELYTPPAVQHYEYAADDTVVTKDQFKADYDAAHIVRKDGVVRLVDNSVDPDAKGAPMASEQTYTYTNANGATVTVPFNQNDADVQLNGKYKVEWSYDIIYSTGTGSTQKLVTVGSAKDNAALNADADGWTTKSLDGMTIKELVTNSTYASWDNLADGAVLTVYQKVTDISARLEAKYNVAADGSKTFVGYRYVNTETNGSGLLTTASQIDQRNISATATAVREITSPPLSAMTLSSTTMYDTATGNTAKITVSRNSSHPQNKDFILSWAMPVSSEYIILEPEKTANGINYYLTVKKDGSKWVGLSYDATRLSGGSTTALYQSIDPSLDPAKNTVSGSTTAWATYASGQGYTYRFQILSATVAESCTFGSAGGEWTIDKSTIQSLVSQGIVSGDTVLQINESIKGYETADATSETIITDRSARAIGFKTDTNPPIAQTVSVSTKRYQLSDGNAATNTDYENEDVWKTSTYQASRYLDITAHDAFNRLTIGGSADNEGALGGYAYYFYTTKVDPATQNTVEDQWYNFKLDGSGNLVRTANYTAGSASAIANAMIKVPASTLATNSFTVDITDKMIASNQGSISFNVGVFAYDTQTGRSTYTGANQSTVTRVENIKLTQSTPMPPEIKVTDAMSNVVAHIGNDAGFYDAATGAKDVATTGKDAEGRSLEFWSNTEVTVQFLPRQGYFSPNEEDGGHLEEDTSGAGSLYYMDKFHQADLTNMAEVTYTLEIMKNGVWEVYSVTDNGVTVEYQDIHINAATNLVVKDSGSYRVTATITNGAGIISESRQVTFNVDVSKPEDPSISVNDNTPTHPGIYLSSNWASEVVVTISGSTDNNIDTAYYTYSMDNGANWIYLAGLKDNSGTQTLVLNGTGIHSVVGGRGIKVSSGEYQLRVKAVDKAGNESAVVGQNIKIDVDGPVMDSKDIILNPQSTVSRYYNEFIVTTSVSTGSVSGAIWPVYSSGLATDTIVSVPTVKGSSPLKSTSQTFKIIPGTGYDFYDLVQGGVSVKSAVSYNGDGTYTYVLNGIEKDTTLAVSFQSSSSPTSFRSAELMKAFTDAPVSTMAEAQLFLDDGGTGENVGSGTEGGTYTIQFGTTGDGAGEITSTTTASGNKVTVAAGQTVTFSLTPYPGSALSSVRLGPVGSAVEIYTKGGALPAEMTQTATGFNLTVSNVGQDMMLLASFGQVPYYTVTVTCDRHGSVTASGAFKTETGSNGESIFSAWEGSNVVLSMKGESSSYAVKSVTLDGAAQTAGATLSINSISANHTVNVTFDLATGVQEQWVRVGIETISEEEDVHGSFYPGSDGYIPGMTDGVTGEKVLGIKVPYGGDLTVTLTPDPGYYLAGVSVVNQNSSKDSVTGEFTVQEGGDVIDISVDTDDEGNPELDDEGNIQYIRRWRTSSAAVSTVVKANGDGSYSVVFRGVKSDSYKVIAYFKVNTWQVTKVTASGGTLDLTWSGDTVASITGNTLSVEQGGTVRAVATPNEGYRISNLIVDGTPVGAQGSWEFANISANHTVEVAFVAKDLVETRTGHSIVAEANNVRDTHDQLATQAYRFRLLDASKKVIVEWSAWQISSIYTFTGLSPNVNYTVEVETQDRAGNTTTASKSVYTLANIPTISSLSSLNEVDADTKSVRASVNSNGNPEGTKYMIYYSERADMQSGVKQTSDEWQLLSANNTLDVGNLSAGRRYYLQIRAINGDGKETGVDEDNIPSILLTPTSPPLNSLHVSEQAGPLGGVTLTWEEPAIEVTGFVIYRNGVEIHTANKATLSYTDPCAGLKGDQIYAYSYAYVNAAGIGSSRSAIIDDYYNADSTGRAKLDALESATDDMIYNETLTYPKFPTQVEVLYNSPESDSNQSGKLQVRVIPDAADMGRYGRYRLGLRYYTKDEDGNYTKKVSSSELASFGVTNTANYNAQWTVTTSSKGAIATWTGLCTDLEYEVYVIEISTTGAAVVTQEQYITSDGTPAYRYVYSDGYMGSTGGVEGQLLKTAHVDNTGYWTEYEFSGYNNYRSLLHEEDGYWESGESQLYTGVLTWDSAMPLLDQPEGAKIKFNKTPGIALPNAAGDLYDSSRGQVVTDANGTYVLIDKTNTDTEEDAKIIIRVAAWDEDGGSATVTGRIGGVVGADGELTGGVVGTTVEPINDIHTTEAAAQRGYYEIVFDGRQLSAGVYDSVMLTVTDGQLVKSVPASLKIVVNQALPNVYITGGNGTRKIEKDAVYTLENRIVTSTSLSSNVEADDLRPLRLLILRDKYIALFGSNDETTIINALTTVNNSYMDTCRELLGSDFDNKDLGYTNTDKTAMTTAGAKAVIDRVQLKVDLYFEVSEAVYNTYSSLGESLIFAETTTDAEGNPVTRYWMDTTEALTKNASDWTTYADTESGTGNIQFRVTGDLNTTHALRLVTHFGRNDSYIITYFKIMEAPNVYIESEKEWGWREAVSNEYLAFQEAEYTVADVYDRYGKADGGAERPADASELAFRCYYSETEYVNKAIDLPAGKTLHHYEIFTLSDLCATIGKTYISANVHVDTGIYDKLLRVGVLITSDASYDPNTDAGASVNTQYKVDLLDPNNTDSATKINIPSGIYTFKTSSLLKNTTYYLWTYYTRPLDNDTESGLIFERDSVVMTTAENYDSTTYGFTIRSLSYKEAEVSNKSSGDTISVAVERLGETSPKAHLKVTAEYFEADEYGNIVKDEDGNEISLRSTSGGAKTLLLNTSSLDFYTTTSTTALVNLKLVDDGDKQGHMVVRLSLSIDTDNAQEPTGYNYLSASGKMMEIFVLDDESPVTSYELGVMTGKVGDENYLKAVMDGDMVDHYEYAFPGLQVGYSISSELVVSYFNAGSGDLTNIKIDIFDEARKELSKYFMATQPPHSDALASQESSGISEVGTVRVMAKTGLPDGIHHAWLKLYADNMEEDDWIWIEVTQVVGQSTLRGQIYIGVDLPENTLVRTGSATVYLYSSDTTYSPSTQTFSTEPLAVTTSSEYGGNYVVPNIINNNRYYLVVKRDGFIAYNGVAAGKTFGVGSTSINMKLNIRLLAGDICGAGSYEPDGYVDEHDLETFIKYYNWNLLPLKAKLESDPESLTAEERMILRCDFNGDWYLNNLDIASIRNNMNKNSLSYEYESPELIA